MKMTLDVNDKKVVVDVAEDTPLLWVLRDHLHLTGTKFGCGRALCGACTVHLDGSPTRSCVFPARAAQTLKITTIEGLSGGIAEALQNAWAKEDVPQCGYCQSGQIMSAAALLESNTAPTQDEVDTAMSGNICRCATYGRIRKAILSAADDLEV